MGAVKAVGVSGEGWRKCRLGEPHGKGGGAGFPLLTRELCAKRLVSTDELIYLRMISDLSGFIISVSVVHR